MDGPEFVAAVKLYVRDTAVKDTIDNCSEPPGRSPDVRLVEISKWYNAIDDHGRSMVQEIVKESIDSGLFGLFCVLDGVRSLEDRDPQGEFKLYYVNRGEQVLLNDFDKELLHDLYNIK